MNTIELLQRAVDFIEDNIMADVNTEVVAGQAYMSGFQFQRIFTAVCGISVGEYVRNRRLSLAGAEIYGSRTKIIDIAYKYGYESPESFSRAFTKFHSITPISARINAEKLTYLPKFDVQTILGGTKMLEKLKERGYAVKENGSVYYTLNMDRTAKWFEDVLGWYAGIDERNDNGDGTYGCLLPIPGEIKNATLQPFNGFHMFFGEPSKATVAFINIDNINALRDYVIKCGWTKISAITEQHWGAKECDVTTIDGGIMRFFQLD